MSLAKTGARMKVRPRTRPPAHHQGQYTMSDEANDKGDSGSVGSRESTEALTPEPGERSDNTRLSIDTTKATKRTPQPTPQSPSRSQSQSRSLNKHNIASASTDPSTASTLVPRSSIPSTAVELKASSATTAAIRKLGAASQPQVQPQPQPQPQKQQRQHQIQPQLQHQPQQQQQPLLATNDMTLTDIISEYGERTDVLRLVLAAKTEQDRAKAEYERRLQEEMRFETRRLEFEMMLHDNYFKQQEQQQQQQQQQQQLGGPVHHLPSHPHPPHAGGGGGGGHRSDMVLHSPVGQPQQAHYVSAPRHQHIGTGNVAQKQQQQQLKPQQATVPTAAMHVIHPQNGAYGGPVVAAVPHDMRAYHHPDTPGGPDAPNAQTPFAFFKTPLGAQVSHPSAFATRDADNKHAPRFAGEMLPPGSVPLQDAANPRPDGNGISVMQQQQQQQRALQHRDMAAPGHELRAVPPAVGGLSLRIGSGVAAEKDAADAPRSAPVDGPNQKRKISHDEVIMALRRKVMSKGMPQSQPQHLQPQHQQQQQRRPQQQQSHYPHRNPQRHMPSLRPVPPTAKPAAVVTRQQAEEQARRRPSFAPDRSRSDAPPSPVASSVVSSESSVGLSPVEGEADAGKEKSGSKKQSESGNSNKDSDGQSRRASSIAHIMDG
ncbi:hypothetical protein IWW48_005259 [Coemansia sp. RSA 1200]|nr:hypothetical protein IWW48_005259 [Coemansia sp. RSA 1200]